MIKKFVLIFVVLVLALGGLAMCVSTEEPTGSDNTTEPSKTEEQSKDEDVSLVGDVDMKMDYGFPKLNGVIQNNSEQDLEYVQIEFTLYDAEGTQIGTALANTTNLKAGNKWEFEAIGDTSSDKEPDHFDYEISPSVF